jgi:hypothetical protein
VTIPFRQVRAVYSEQTIIVYQAYPPEIAEPAVSARAFRAAGPAVTQYVDEWIVGLNDVTATAQTIHGLLRSGATEAARELLPPERPYPLPEPVSANLGASG